MNTIQCAFTFFLCLTALCLVIEAARFMGLHKRLRSIRKSVLPAPSAGVIAGRTGRYYVRSWNPSVGRAYRERH